MCDLLGHPRWLSPMMVECANYDLENSLAQGLRSENFDPG